MSGVVDNFIRKYFIESVLLIARWLGVILPGPYNLVRIFSNQPGESVKRFATVDKCFIGQPGDGF